MNGWAAAARHVVERLQTLHRPAEETFLTVGSHLHQAYDVSRTLAVMANALASRLAEQEFQDTLHGLDAAVDLVAHLRSETGGGSAGLQDIVEAAGTIQHSLAALGRTMFHIGVLGVNAKVETAQLAVASVDFTVFTHGIEQLAGRGRQALNQAVGDLARLSAAASSAMAGQAEFAATHAREIAEVGDRLLDSVAAMRARERQAAAALEQLPRELQASEEGIGRIVTDLQIGDITRQRLEHVEHALEMLAGVLAGDRLLSDEELSEQQRRIFANAVAELQARQLDHIEAEVSGRVGEIDRNLRSLADSISAIQTSTESVYADGADGGSTFLMAVDHDLEKVARVVAHYAGAMALMRNGMAQVGEAAAAMGAFIAEIREIDADINVIGLNASIKCGNLGGKGRALNVIAQELRTFARQTRTQSQAIGERLAQVTASADGLAQDRSDSAGHELEALKTSLDETVARLRQAGGETAWVLSRIREQSQSVVAAIEQAAAHLRAWQTHAEAIRQGARDLQALAGDADPGLDAAVLDQARHELLSFMQAHYTMASERDIHSGLLSGQGREDIRSLLFDEQTEPAAAGEPDLSDVLF